VIGVVIVSHYRLAEELLQAVCLIVGEVENFRAIGLDPDASPEDMRARIDKTLRELDTGSGVLVLTDMFGGTPSNLCLSFLDEGRVEVVTGVNRPMLVKLARVKTDLSIQEAAELGRDTGRRNISVASDILAGRAKPDAGP
jgi:PTS system mannose-specific IIA component